MSPFWNELDEPTSAVEEKSTELVDVVSSTVLHQWSRVDEKKSRVELQKSRVKRSYEE